MTGVELAILLILQALAIVLVFHNAGERGIVALTVRGDSWSDSGENHHNNTAIDAYGPGSRANPYRGSLEVATARQTHLSGRNPYCYTLFIISNIANRHLL